MSKKLKSVDKYIPTTEEVAKNYRCALPSVPSSVSRLAYETSDGLHTLEVNRDKGLNAKKLDDSFGTLVEYRNGTTYSIRRFWRTEHIDEAIELVNERKDFNEQQKENLIKVLGELKSEVHTLSE